ncbi:unnamed protein product [Lactuca saligna]|uniref:RRM domain-containing protein n=1 Tax=Lactuca saligna TaxID=75948 RepID=A0AA35VB37_LACSI|nr:unnamed protein product [Lactuca saligna]
MGPKIRSSNKDFIEILHKIYAGNLSWSITSEKIKDTFDEQPGFLSARVIYEKQSGKSQGFECVTFSSPEAVEYALNAMDGLVKASKFPLFVHLSSSVIFVLFISGLFDEQEVEGRPLRLNLA